MSMVIDGSNGLTYPNSATNGGYINGGTAVASTSGTSIDFTGIPSWVKRITVMFNGVSTNSTADYWVQVGSGSISTTGYAAVRGYINNASSASSGNWTSTIIAVPIASSSAVMCGHVVLTLISANTWIASSLIGDATANLSSMSMGKSPALSGALDRVRITTSTGTDTFDAGSINILYE